MELSPIHPASPSFSQLEYDLQSLSKASTLRITQAWEISNPNLTVQFDRRSRVSSFSSLSLSIVCYLIEL